MDDKVDDDEGEVVEHELTTAHCATASKTALGHSYSGEEPCLSYGTGPSAQLEEIITRPVTQDLFISSVEPRPLPRQQQCVTAPSSSLTVPITTITTEIGPLPSPSEGEFFPEEWLDSTLEECLTLNSFVASNLYPPPLPPWINVPSTATARLINNNNNTSAVSAVRATFPVPGPVPVPLTVAVAGPRELHTLTPSKTTTQVSLVSATSDAHSAPHRIHTDRSGHPQQHEYMVIQPRQFFLPLNNPTRDEYLRNRPLPPLPIETTLSSSSSESVITSCSSSTSSVSAASAASTSVSVSASPTKEVMIDGLTPEELFESICFENDHEGTPGFFGPAEFAREQKKRKEDEEQLKSGAAVVSNNKSSPGVVVKISKAMVSTTAALFGY